MADWYASSTAYAAIAQWAATHTYAVGNIIRSLAAPANPYQYYTFRCSAITTGTSGSTEPTWTSAQNNGNTVTDSGVTWTNVTGVSTYGWSAAAGNLFTMLANNNNARVLAGDRCFVSSDHSESTTSVTWRSNNGNASPYGVAQIISVNRAGSVPPTAADAQSGAAAGTSSGQALTIEAECNFYWQGVTINSGATLNLNNSGAKRHYFRNCVIALIRSSSGDQVQASNPSSVVFDNTQLTFTNTGQGILFGSYNTEINWFGTASAIGGSAVPLVLFKTPPAQSGNFATLRGIDLSALNTSLTQYGGNGNRLLLDSCRIASALTRITGTIGSTTDDNVELVNCYDGTNANISERHTPAGDLTTDRSTTLVGGAQDDVGLFAHKLISSSRSDFLSMPLESFWLDCENTLIGALRTATVEIISSASLNNTDISLTLEYLGTSGSSLASFTSTLPSALTASSAIPTSSATWNNPPTTPVAQHIQVTFTPQQAGRLRGIVRLGKASATVWINPQIVVT